MDFNKQYISFDDDDEQQDEQNLPSEFMEYKLIGKHFLDKRQVFLWGGVDDKSAREIITKMLYLDAAKPKTPITFFINSPGGYVTAGMAIMDVMNLISSPVYTVCMGLAASMGSILLSAGEKGHRYIFPHGEVMIHQPSMGRVTGRAADIEIHTKQILKSRQLGAEILAKNCGQPIEKILKDFDRDYWMNADESLAYGIVDKIYESF